jgi:hypothetical protein
MDIRIHNSSTAVRRILPGLVMAAIMLLQGCATLNREECMVADWRLIGYQDGVAGKSASAVGSYRKDCAEHAVVPDLDAYQAGRIEGLQEYCKVDNGYQLGRAGKGYATVCPADLEPGFRLAYNEGREIYIARSVVKRTRARIKTLQADLTHIDEDRKYLLVDLVSDGLKGSERVSILYELSELGNEKDAIEDELDVLHGKLADQQAYLESLTQHASR